MVEGTPLLRAQMVLSRLEGSNPFLSATIRTHLVGPAESPRHLRTLVFATYIA